MYSRHTVDVNGSIEKGACAHLINDENLRLAYAAVVRNSSTGVHVFRKKYRLLAFLYFILLVACNSVVHSTSY